MQVFGYEVDENYGFVLNCGKLDPIELRAIPKLPIVKQKNASAMKSARIVAITL